MGRTRDPDRQRRGWGRRRGGAARAPSDSRNWRWIEPFLPPRSRLRLSGIGAGSFLGGLAESSVLVIMTLVAEALIRGVTSVDVVGNSLSSTTIVLVALGLLAARVALMLVTARTAARFSADVMGSAQRSLVQTYLSSTHALRSSRPVGDLQSVVITHGRFTGDLANAWAQMAASVCGLLAFGLTSLVINPMAFLVIAAVGGVLVAGLRPLRSHSRGAARAFEATTRHLGQEVAEVESLHREIHVFRVESAVEQRVREGLDDAGARYRRVRFLGQAVPQSFQSVLMAAAVLGLLAVAQTAGNGANLATAGAVVLLLIRSMSAAQQLVTANQRVIELSSYARGLGELIDTLQSHQPAQGSDRPAVLTPIRLERVAFEYNDGTKVFDGLDLEFTAGQVVGVAGPSGAGKSTLVELLLQLRLPTSGSVTYGGVPTERIDPEEFARRVAIVPQTAVLIEGTIAENVAFFRPISETEVREALRRADLEEHVEALPDGIHTHLGADRKALSGGQRQRLTIARALAGRPEVIVLDEPTSALDARSEAAVTSAIRAGSEGRVTIVVAHRFSTLRSCDRVLVLQNGRVEFDGGPEAVTERSTFFRSMLDAESL